MKIVIHIGTPKSGSTLIQFFCIKNSEKLLEQGVLFPKNVFFMAPDGRKNRASGHHHFITALRDNSDELLFQLENEITTNKNIDTLLFSSENFSFNPDIIPKLKGYFEKYSRIKIIVYLRRQDNYLESLYGEFISGGWKKVCDSPEEFVSKTISGDTGIICDYKKLLEPWAEAFGKENICVRPFEKGQWIDGDLIKDFLKAAEIQWREDYLYPGNEFENVSVSPEVNKAIRHINKVPLTGNYYREMLSEMFLGDLADYKGKEKQCFISPGLRLEIMKRFDPSNFLIAKEYLRLENESLFKEPVPGNGQQWKPVKVNDPDLVLTVIASLLQKKDFEYEEKWSDLDNQILSVIKDTALLQERINLFENAIKEDLKLIEKRHEKKLLYAFSRSRKNIFRRCYRFVRYGGGQSEIAILKRAGLIDRDYYLNQYPETKKSGLSVVSHYVCHGAQEGKNPSMDFNTLKYMAENADVVYWGVNPLVHYYQKRKIN